MTRYRVLLLLILVLSPALYTSLAQNSPFRVLAFYSTNVEQDHIDFARQALTFYAEKAKANHFDFTSTTKWDDLNPLRLKSVDVVLWLNDSPHTPEQRSAFQEYMGHGGGWLGFHVAAYNDADTHWLWFVDFLGGGVFFGNNWPPLPALLHVDDQRSMVTEHMPTQFMSPANEWYIWKPSPRLNKSVKVLVTLDPSNYPLGLKDALLSGDLPVVWSNTSYRMVYINMGHGDKIFADQVQNRLLEDALLSVGRPRKTPSQSSASAQKR